MSGRAEAIVLGFADYREQGQRLAQAAGLAYAEIRLHAFPDGESLLRLPERLPPHVVFCRPLIDANRRLIELELAMATAERLGASRLTLVAPYLCYMRQDKAFQAGEAISQRIIGDFLAHRLDTLITVDPHLHRIRSLAEAVPVRSAVAVSAASVMASWLGRQGTAPLVVGPDEESEQWVSAIARPGGLEYCVARKQRYGDRDIRIVMPEVHFRDRDVVLADDVVSTGTTLAEAAQQIMDRGARSLTAMVSHAVFAEGSLDRLRSAGVTRIVSTDSIPHSSNALRLHHLLAAALMAEPGMQAGTASGGAA